LFLDTILSTPEALWRREDAEICPGLYVSHLIHWYGAADHPPSQGTALLKRLKEITRKQRITHAEIAKRAGTSRTRVTAILNDDLVHVSSDLLIRILASLGYRVKVSVVRSDSAA
jgi:hypothetical protein